jgi:hypothetical protein
MSLFSNYTYLNIFKVNAFLNEKAKELGPGITDLIVSTISSNIRQVELLKLDLSYQDLIRGNDLSPIEQVASSEQ